MSGFEKNIKVTTEKVEEHDDDYDDDVKIYKKHTEIIKRFFENVSFDIMHPEFNSVRDKKDRDERNLIHSTIAEVKRRQKPKGPRLTQVHVQNALNVISALALDSPGLLTQEDANEKIPLFEAAKYSATIFFGIIDLVVPIAVLETITVRCKMSEQNCPIELVPERRRARCRNTRNYRKPTGAIRRQRTGPIDVIDTMNTVTDGASDENSCLHGEIDVNRVVKEDKQLRKILSAALNHNGHHQKMPCLESLIVESNFDTKNHEDVPMIPLHSFESLLQLCPDSVFDTPGPNGYTPLQTAVLLYDKQNIEYDHLYSVIEALVERLPASIYFETTQKDEKKTVYRILKRLGAPKSQSNRNSRERTEELLKRACVGSPNKTHEEKMKFLYWEAKYERQICLNLKGESAVLDTDYIEIIRKRSGMKFETVLDFVKLPYWEPQNKEATGPEILVTQSREASSYGPGRTRKVETLDPYVAIFQWLRNHGVQKIFTVEIDDDGPNPHTNAAIRDCFMWRDQETDEVRSLEVEIWKWKKFDICSETVFIAAPSVREAHLYSSGNTAVLRSWGCTSGLAKLNNLQQLTIEIYPKNANDKKDCEDYVPHLKKGLREQCPLLTEEDITIKVKSLDATELDMQGSNQRADLKDIKKDGPNATPKANEWINKLRPLKQFLKGLPVKEQSMVKVAILDDGAKLKDLEGLQLLGGKGFRPDNQEFCVGPCSHGTLMAQCIRDICPMASFYIARLDDSRPVENPTTLSCYQALKWALEMGVDIISMSWTFEKRGYNNDPHEKKFVDLIDGKKALFFASLPDSGPNNPVDKYLPVGVHEVIKIGSATDFGERSKENLFSTLDFMLPGENLKTASGEIVSGSSFSTAYAAGVAALVLHSLRAHMEIEDPYRIDEVTDADDNRIKRWKAAKTTEGMKSIFKVLSGADSREPFVRPYNMYNGVFGASENQKKKIIQDIANVILPPDKLSKLYRAIVGDGVE